MSGDEERVETVTARCERTEVVANEGIDVVDVRAHMVVTRLARKSVDPTVRTPM